jgi:enhancer of polycomb-like protein
VIHNRENRPASPSFARAAAKPATQPLPAYFIPTPNASGKAEDYESLLPTGRPIWTDPSELIKSSEKVEECCYGRGGLNYEMDDTDILWLEQLNGKDDGPSNEVTNARSNRKANQKEKDGGFVKLPADIFEYLMGLFELWTEKNVPMLHTDLSLLPPLSSIESVLKVTPPASYFPSFEQPKDLPSPSTLIKYANKIYSHWKARKEQRKGKSIIPQLNFDEANESDPYLCFRRRDLKVQRKTRIKDTTPVSRLDQVQAELNSATLLVNMVLMRERQKQRTLKAEKELWDARWSLLDIKRKNPGLPLSQDEEILLFPHRISSASGQPSVKRQRVADRDREQREREDAARVAHLQGVSMLRGMRSRAVSPVGERVPPEQLAGMFAEKVEREMSRRIEIDRFAEETTALAYQPFPQPVPFKHFRCLPASDLSLRPQHLPETVSDEEHDNSLPDSIPSRPNHHMCFRLRRGRGGLTRLDRKMPSVRHLARSHLRSAIIEEPAKRWFPTNPLAKRNLADTNSSVLDHARSGAGDALDFQDSEEDRSRQLSERWRYDYDGGLVGVGMGVKDEDQVVIDDYETR